jgi:UDP-N-acetylmuramate dehydrogenase
VVAAASAPWDSIVEAATARGLAGLECLSGIPGSAGAAPIQNIGAYGQEVAEAIAAVWVIDRASGERRRIPGGECGFGYRTSHFKTRWAERVVVEAVELSLQAGAPGAVRYAELEARFAGRPVGEPPPSPAAVRQEVLALRRAKSMLLDPADPNHRSAGSFFVNPTVAAGELAAVREAARRVAPPGRSLPEHPAADGRVKLAAAWLIEAAGFPRGFTRGRAGLSSRHALALVNRGGATARELIELAALIRTRVRAAFGVTLEPEPVLLGFREPVGQLLGG